jgi:hypothetical protein
MQNNPGKNKTKLTALAQLIRILGDYKGLTKVADLVSETGYTKQAIYKAKSELEWTSQPELTKSPPELKSQPGLVNQGLQSQPELTPRAYKESSSKINNSNSQLASRQQAISNWIIEEFGSDPDSADQLVERLSNQHGIDKAIQGQMDYLACKAEHTLKSRSLQTYCGFVANARLQAQRHLNGRATDTRSVEEKRAEWQSHMGVLQ